MTLVELGYLTLKRPCAILAAVYVFSFCLLQHMLSHTDDSDLFGLEWSGSELKSTPSS